MTVNKQKALFFLAFTAVGFLALQIPLTHLAGSKATFTLFDAFAPMSGAFLGGILGAASVLAMQLINFFVHGNNAYDVGTIVRLFPLPFAALYFGSNKKSILLAPLVAILIFNLDPIGRSVWYFSLFWTVPIICHFFRERFLLARSLGATFTAHAVGGALWVHFVGLPKSVWISLIPVVIIERLTFAVAGAALYFACNTLLHAINAKKLLPFQLPVNQRHVWGVAH